MKANGLKRASMTSGIEYLEPARAFTAAFTTTDAPIRPAPIHSPGLIDPLDDLVG
jgi:hypothetical protein